MRKLLCPQCGSENMKAVSYSRDVCQECSCHVRFALSDTPEIERYGIKLLQTAAKPDVSEPCRCEEREHLAIEGLCDACRRKTLASDEKDFLLDAIGVNDEIYKKHMELAEKEIDSLKSQLSYAQGKRDAQKLILNSLKTDIKNLNYERVQLKSDLDYRDQVIAQRNNECSALQKENERLKQQLSEWQATAAKGRKVHSELIEERAEHLKTLDAAEANCRMNMATIAQLKSENEKLRNTLSNIRALDFAAPGQASRLLVHAIKLAQQALAEPDKT